MGWIDKEDEQFGARLQKSLKRKQSSSKACPSTIQSQLVPDNRSAQDEIDFPLVDEKDSDDSDHNANIKKSKKSETTLMEIPRKILTPSLSQSLDRIKTLDHTAMRDLSSTLQSFKTIEGKNLDLKVFTLLANLPSTKIETVREVISIKANSVKFN